MKTKAFAAIAVLAALALPAVVLAHAEITPATAPAGDLALLTLQIPNENDTASTTRVSVQLPKEVLLVRFAPKPGWKRTVTTGKLAQASKVGDDAVTERIATVTWTGGTIAPGEFETFSMSVALPDTPGTAVVFPTVQTYDNGDVVRWIGGADAPEPAPRVTATAVEEGSGHAATHQPTAASGDSGKTNAALGFGIAGLAAGLGALVLGLLRRRTTPSGA